MNTTTKAPGLSLSEKDCILQCKLPSINEQLIINTPQGDITINDKRAIGEIKAIIILATISGRIAL